MKLAKVVLLVVILFKVAEESPITSSKVRSFKEILFKVILVT